MAVVPLKIAPPLPDGVYFNLFDDDYFGQEALGSSDLITLHFKREGWWWQSRYNPDAAQRSTKELLFGNAAHAILLEGLATYESRYIAEPDRPADAIDGTIDECRTLLLAGGFELGGASKWKVDDWRRAMRLNMPEVEVWPTIKADFLDELGPEDLPGRRKPLPAASDRALRFMHQVATGDGYDNASIRKLLAEGGDYPPLAEVAVFCTVAGVRRRWKFDRMFPRFDLDLKTLGGWTGRPLPWEVGESIAKRGMDIQRADYHVGREVAYALIRAGKVYGGTPEQRSWLASFPDAHPKWDWVWLFYQKPDPKGKAPVLFPLWDDSWVIEADANGHAVEAPGDVRKWGLHKAARAISFYKQSVAVFGLREPWARVDPLHFTDENAKPRVFLPHWISAEDQPTDAAAYDQEDSTDGQ